MKKNVPTHGELLVQLVRECERTKFALENAQKACEELEAEKNRLKLQIAKLTK